MPLSKFICNAKTAVHAKRERRKEARPGELLEAALELFVEKGFAATRAEEVARLAGVSKGTLFLYFSSKEELFKAVVRENISGRFPEWNAEFAAFTGSTPDLLRYCLKVWWERVGATKASGITKLMTSEASNFPELAEFYRHEVIEPGHELIRRILQRGVDRGEFRSMDITCGVYTVMAPMMFLMTWKHSFGPCLGDGSVIDPEAFIAQQVDTLLHGICTSTAPPPPPQ
ncbi:MAG: TetR/AcrR family transcriptional regulator [Gammaproteobacteria bacterium]|nr:TetR/AcrR family transcriptional regulator [Gammaproteobacteria bacterium]MBU0787890.1 TetR/AcrR family transcriptional regulator [Gammaproteobacteria bacterium]